MRQVRQSQNSFFFIDSGCTTTYKERQVHLHHFVQLKYLCLLDLILA